MSELSLVEMLEAGVHYGHKTRYWHPQMAPYIFGQKNDVHIINLELTRDLMKRALDTIAQASRRKAKILFVGTKRSASEIVREAATKAGMPYVDYRWLGGMLTNYKTIRQSIKRLKDLEMMCTDGTFNRITKKEVIVIGRQIEKLRHSLGGIKDMAGLPDMLFVIDVGHERIAVTEAQRLGIPVVGIVDTNNSPDGIDYIIPGNDDGMRAIRYYTNQVVNTILQAREEKAAAATPVAAKSKPAVTEEIPPPSNLSE